MSKHTPGPWSLTYLPQHRYRITYGEHTTICDVALWMADYGEQEANARLITAAPDLLEALIETRNLIGRDVGEDVEWATKMADDAIAKAEGATDD